MSARSSKTWLITGCSSGLGLELARAVLAAGHKVIASSRNPSKTPDAVREIIQKGGQWVTLDVSADELETQLSETLAAHGPVDVLVNNAGYASGGVLETMSLSDAKAQLDTNFYGAVRTIQAVVPGMREHKTGVIVNVSSAEFWHAHPCASVYAASKFALEGLSEALAGELGAFGIRILIVEPGGMRTKFLDVDPDKLPGMPGAYKGTMADFVLQAILATNGKQALSARKAADAIVEEVLHPLHDPPMLRMPLGKESLEAMKAKAEMLKSTTEVFEKVALAADFKT